MIVTQTKLRRMCLFLLPVTLAIWVSLFSWAAANVIEVPLPSPAVSMSVRTEPSVSLTHSAVALKFAGKFGASSDGELPALRQVSFGYSTGLELSPSGCPQEKAGLAWPCRLRKFGRGVANLEDTLGRRFSAALTGQIVAWRRRTFRLRVQLIAKSHTSTTQLRLSDRPGSHSVNLVWSLPPLRLGGQKVRVVGFQFSLPKGGSRSNAELPVLNGWCPRSPLAIAAEAKFQDLENPDKWIETAGTTLVACRGR